jgi:quinol monooxygenase YgiN
MNTPSESSPQLDASQSGASVTQLDPASGYVTIINTYTVSPERAEELLSFLVRSTLSTIRFVPGFVSANLHVSLDRTQVVNYAQWLTPGAIAGARENPKVGALIREQAQIAESFTPIQYELKNSTLAYDASGSGARFAKLAPGAGLVTTLNVYTIAPDRAEEVLAYLVHSATETVRHEPGFVSFNFHLSLDRTKIANYGQWASREAVAAVRDNPKIVELTSATARIAGKSVPTPYVLRNCLPAAGRD